MLNNVSDLLIWREGAVLTRMSSEKQKYVL